MAKIRLECLYCGKVWNDTVWSAEQISAKCSDCGETKLIKAKQISEEDGNDIYGYGYKESK